MGDRSEPGNAHFQLFAADWKGSIRWRLLSGNNRDIGRSATIFADVEAGLVAITDVVVRIPDLRPLLRRAEAGRWRWSLLLNGEPVVVGAHAYDRQLRCEEAVAQFCTAAATARISDSVMASQSRRWTNGSAGRPLAPTPRARPIQGTSGSSRVS